MNLTAPTSYLFVPGDRPERFAKAAASGADMVVLDLEDAVAPERKAFARAQARAALMSGEIRACVRVNGVDTEWFLGDCELLALPGARSAMLPKAEGAEAIATLRTAGHADLAIVPVIETAKGLDNAREVARSPGVLQLAFGSVDFQRDLNIEGDDLELLLARSQLVLISRLAGLAGPVDGVTLSLVDVGDVRKDALRARRMGFTGKLCIHPAQVAAVNSAFAPDEAQVQWARGVLAAAASSPSGALRYDGQLVDKPVIDRAHALLAQAAR